MPNGVVHNTATLVLAAGCAPFAPWVAGGCLVNLVLTPDLDLNGSKPGAKLLSSITPMLGLAHNLYWYPYGLLFKHRGVSHWPFIGTATRLLYFVPLWPVLWYYGDREQLWLAVAGLCLADMLHAGLDWLDKLMGGRL